MKYLTETRFERNANNGLELHDRLEDAVETVEVNLEAGALIHNHQDH